MEDLSFTGTLVKSYVHRGILKTKSNICDGVFFNSVKPYFKNVINLMELSLGSIFYTTHPIMKKILTVKTQENNSFVNNGKTFFWKFEITQ